MELGLKGKKALVTGGSKGIGLAIKKALEAEGVEVIDWSRTCGYDLEEIIPKLPKVDFLINNLGGRGTWSVDEFRKVWNINCYIAFNLIIQFLKTKNKGKQKRVITISSIYGKEKGPNPGFTAAKAAQIAFMKSLAGKYNNLTFNTICPGHIDVGKNFPYKPKKVGTPDDVADIVLFLCSEKAKHIDGAVITVDGGESHSF